MSTRATSIWGWGYADKFPDTEARRALAEQVSPLLGGPSLEPHEPASAPRLPSPRVAPPPSLSTLCSVDEADRAAHTYGKGYGDLVRGFHGDFSSAPDFVARPRSEEDVRALMDWCGDHHVALIPFGGGTSVVRGVEAAIGNGFRGAVSMDLRRLDRVVEVDPISRSARIQAGATGPVLESQLAPHGFTLRHFPQSFEFSTLGGWIATRAGGHFATLYTHIDDLVQSTRMLTPRGLYETRRLPASGAGPSPDRLVLGSEGTLGVITEAWVRLQSRPRFRASASVHFSEFDAAVRAVRELSQSGLHPSNCRLLDAQESFLNGVAGDGSSVLVLAFESADHPLHAWMERALAITASHGGECREGARYRSDEPGVQPRASGAAESWRSAFIEAPYLQNVMVSLGVIADTFETACTWDRFDSLHGAILDAVRGALERFCGGGTVSCRFTHVYPDGPAPYYTFLGPAKRGGELEQWMALKQAASEAISAHGGTITHHHAVGRLHRPWYDRERPEPFALALKAVKGALDPRGILNPGVLVGP
ncbi:FAD-binding oxidoreductase [Archangium violaceum]|uniref:FAD-linked oxidase n=1 Tax=Archangium violaceum Cb vi76 TaxID=1406225 RepID=A0A084SWX2_9BACT|nr:FAD-binding oxidoreductase [Archangium violaceum]KFA92957.1 FAD-linked oxidase [Archangium violaceum Cb vi76]